MNKLIQVFEHQTLRVGQHNTFTQELLEALQRHHGEGVPYYSLVHNSVKFNQHVGVIQVGGVTIEILPKVEKNESDKTNWSKKLVDMLLVVNTVDAKITGNASLKLKANSILEAYFAIFISEVERLLHQGLIKQYHKTQANLTALKGRINFSQHIRHNQVHKERFFVEYTVYDNHNCYNQILYKTIKLIAQFNGNSQLMTRINLLLLNFPELDDIYVDQNTFEKIIYTRKNQHYQSALNIAKLILLNYHPDIEQGKHSVLSLMFDMNILWEKFVLASLRRFNHEHNRNSNIEITEQVEKDFWKSEHDTRPITLKPDIVIEIGDSENKKCFVLDTKWKCPDYQKPSVEDLRQLYAYHHYYTAHQVALVYPSIEKRDVIKGFYSQNTYAHPLKGNMECALLFIHSANQSSDIKAWQEDIYQSIFKWCGLLSEE